MLSKVRVSNNTEKLPATPGVNSRDVFAVTSSSTQSVFPLTESCATTFGASTWFNFQGASKDKLCNGARKIPSDFAISSAVSVRRKEP